MTLDQKYSAKQFELDKIFRSCRKVDNLPSRPGGILRSGFRKFLFLTKNEGIIITSKKIVKLTLRKALKITKSVFNHVHHKNREPLLSSISNQVSAANIMRLPVHHTIQNSLKIGMENAKPVTLPSAKHDTKSDITVTRQTFFLSILMPVFNPSSQHLKAAIESVIRQTATQWELCIADDCSTTPETREILSHYQALDHRIKCVFRDANGHISAACNTALEIARGEFFCVLDQDDLLDPQAVECFLSCTDKYPDFDLFYSDEDKVNEKGIFFDPFLKPSWSPDTLLSKNYLCHLTFLRTELVKKLGGFRKGYEGGQDYDLYLRVTEQTNKIGHIPKILYHWRAHSLSTAASISAKPYALEASRKALEEALSRRGEEGYPLVTPGEHFVPAYFLKRHPLISIIIPFRDQFGLLDTCLKSIFTSTPYDNYEIILINNQSNHTKLHSFLNIWSRELSKKASLFSFDEPFNFSRMMNFGRRKARGEFLLLLNNDTKILSSNWATSLLEQAQRPSIGAVGATLLYPDHTIQHAGLVLGLGGIAGHGHRFYHSSSSGYRNFLFTVNNVSAVTAACLMCSTKAFDRVSGFSEELAISFNDVDFCLKLLSKGYWNVILPHVVLTHFESKSRNSDSLPENFARFSQEKNFMESRWGNILRQDPFYHPSLSLTKDNFSPGNTIFLKKN